MTHAAWAKRCADHWVNFGPIAVGDYRIICDLKDEKLRVLVVRLGNRKDVYR